MYDDEELNKIVERAIPLAELDCAPTGRCICSRPACSLCRPACSLCFLSRVPEFGPPATNSEAWLVATPEEGEKCGGIEVAGSPALSHRRAMLDEIVQFHSSVRRPRFLGPDQLS